MTKLNIKKILKKLNIKIQKRLGQHFLIDQKVVEDIISAADLTKDDCVLEVGPGLGVLTEALAKKAKKVFTVEKDKNLVAYLQKKFKNFKNVEIIYGDILKIQILWSDHKLIQKQAFSQNKVNASLVFKNNFCKSYKIIANLPFYLTSRFLRLYLEPIETKLTFAQDRAAIKFALTSIKPRFPKPNLMVLLIQKEVAEKIVAKPGDMSLLSVSCQLYSEPKIIRFVSSKSFFPAPQVSCAIIKLKIFKKPKYEIDDLKLFFRIVKAGFAGKRKQLHNTLSAGLVIPDEKIKEILRKSQIDPSRRPQTLSLEEWVRLYKNLKLKKTKSD